MRVANKESCFPLLADIALMLRTSVVVVLLHPEGFPLPAGCRPIPPKNGSQVQLVGKGLMPDSSRAEQAAVNTISLSVCHN